jgi:hypothetical protein
VTNVEPRAYLPDLIYFDADKAASIFSQLQGGLVRETQETTEQGRDRRRGLALNLAGFRPELGETTRDRTSVIETRVLHHDLLLQIEEALTVLGASVDLNTSTRPASIEAARALVEDASYVRAEGHAVIEDYERIQNIAREFPYLLEFIQKAAMSSVEQLDELRELRDALEREKASANQRPKHQRQASLRKVAAKEQQLDEQMRQALGLEAPPEQWLIDGIQKWIDIFLPGRITIRVYPFEHLPSFQVLGNLKRDAFVDADLGNLLFAYGTRPNVMLTVFGLVTSLPGPDEGSFDPMAEFETDSEGDVPDEVAFERAFRGLFEGVGGFESLGRFSRYPNATLYPLAVYRRVPVSQPHEALESLGRSSEQ